MLYMRQSAFTAYFTRIRFYHSSYYYKYTRFFSARNHRMVKRNKYVVWTAEEERTIINYVNKAKATGRRASWTLCADLVGKKPRQCFDLYRNRTTKQTRGNDYDFLTQTEKIVSEQMCEVDEFNDRFTFLVFDNFE